MKVRRVFAIAAAFGVALVPAAVSASTTTTTTYTKNTAGYSVSAKFKAGSFSTSVYLPPTSSLSGVTTGVTAEIRLYDQYGENDFQVGGGPSNYSYHSSTSVRGLPYSAGCTSADFPSPDTINMTVQVRSFGWNYPDSNIIWNASDSSGNSAYCEFDFGVVLAFSKMQLVTAFNVKGFHAPVKPLTAGAFSGIQVNEGTNVCCNVVFGTMTTFPHGKITATSTGTASGVKREVPSNLDPAGDAFTVTMP